jgi:hypothetical protein
LIQSALGACSNVGCVDQISGEIGVSIDNIVSKAYLVFSNIEKCLAIFVDHSVIAVDIWQELYA